MLNFIVIIVSMILGNKLVKTFTRNMIMSTYMYFTLNVFGMGLVYVVIGSILGLV